MKKDMTYTEAADRLEAIVRQIEHNAPDVDELTKLVGEAVELTKFCRKKLTVADKQLTELMAQLGNTEGID
ncbi:MAG: exodeoxyribonuclease VII small subunit [Porphyromonadaceae bacterium]|nr:exodeoxyribonuclease VII small subunit [Porphyromonadaceae bacterium]